MTMTKQHFEAIAKIIQELDNEAGNGATGYQVAMRAVDLFAGLGARSNPRFDRLRFRRACVPGANVKSRKA